MLKNDLISFFKIQQVLPIINTSNLKEDIKKVEKILSEYDHLKCIEITLRATNSFEIAIKIKKEFPNIIFGLGSILNLNDLKKAENSGFKFFVSPVIINEILDLNPENYIPGGETVSEFFYLFNRGYKIIKFFPASLVGADKKLISIQNIFKNIKFIPTGGINTNNINKYLDCKNVLCVGMSKN